MSDKEIKSEIYKHYKLQKININNMKVLEIPNTIDKDDQIKIIEISRQLLGSDYFTSISFTDCKEVTISEIEDKEKYFIELIKKLNNIKDVR